MRTWRHGSHLIPACRFNSSTSGCLVRNAPSTQKTASSFTWPPFGRAETIRGRPADAAVFAGLRRERLQVYPVDTRVGIRAGQLLEAAGRGSARAVDAFLVAAADLAGGGVVATVDVDDLELLVSHAKAVRIVSIQP
jgi:hypothetical protein